MRLLLHSTRQAGDGPGWLQQLRCRCAAAVHAFLYGWRDDQPRARAAAPLLRLVRARPEPDRRGDREQPVDNHLARCYPRGEAELLLRLMVERARRHRQVVSVILLQVAAPAGAAAVDGWLLNEMSGFLLQRLRCIDVVARWEEAAFAVFLPGVTAEQACRVAARLQHCLASASGAGVGAVGVGDTSGVASATPLAPAARQILFQAGRRQPRWRYGYAAQVQPG